MQHPAITTRFDSHPTVRLARSTPPKARPAGPLDAVRLRQQCLDAGADDVGFVELERPELDQDREDILAAFPAARTLVSFVCRLNPTSIRSPARSVANLEFHRAGDEVNEVARRIIGKLEEAGARGLNPSMGFPMEMDRFPGKIWVVSHKRVAEAAGLGRMGIHRNLIHPRFGNFILLGTVITDREVSRFDAPVDYNPCLECKLCVAACPVGAVKPDGRFDFSACYTHNYREFMGGFTDWVGQVAESSSLGDYLRRVTPAESSSMWQSLSFGANYKAAYCLAVCPAGEDLIGPLLDSRQDYVREVVSPLQKKQEPVYVVPDSDAESHVSRRFPHKTVRRVRGSLRPRDLDGFLMGLGLVFQRDQSKGLPPLTYHFSFDGRDHRQATVSVRDQELEVERRHAGTPDLHVRADTDTWLGFLAGERSIVWALLTRRIRLQGPLRLLRIFGRLFPV